MVQGLSLSERRACRYAGLSRKCLTVVNDFSRECVDIAVDHGLGGEYVVRLLDQAVPRLPAGHPHRSGA